MAVLCYVDENNRSLLGGSLFSLYLFLYLWFCAFIVRSSMEALFRAFDVDQSGKISYQEWKTGILALALVKNFHVDVKEIEMLFRYVWVANCCNLSFCWVLVGFCLFVH